MYTKTTAVPAATLAATGAGTETTVLLWMGAALAVVGLFLMGASRWRQSRQNKI